jgi:hypothetical protein
MFMLDIGKLINKSALIVVVCKRYDTDPASFDLACPFVVPDVTPKLSGSDTPILINSCSFSI